MTCDEILTRPFPACATEFLVGTTDVTANPHQVRLRNLATDRRERFPATVDGLGFVSFVLPRPLVAGHEYTLELVDADGSEGVHQITLCSQTSTIVRLRPVLEYDQNGDPVQVPYVSLQCPA